MEVSSLNNSMQTNSVNTSAEVKPAQSKHSDGVKSQATSHVSAPQTAMVNEYMKHNNETAGNSIRQHVQDIRSEEVEKQMREIVDSINSKLTTNTEVNLAFHSKSNRLNIKIIDKETKEVVKEWPSEKSLELLAKLIDKEAVVLDKKL